MATNKSFGDFINDMTTLDVVTLTGDLTIQMEEIAAGDPAADEDAPRPLRFKRVMQQLEGNLAKRGNRVSALAATHVSLDKDTVTFVKENLSPEEAAYLDFHNETVKAAGIARAAMADGIAKLLLGSKK